LIEREVELEDVDGLLAEHAEVPARRVVVDEVAHPSQREVALGRDATADVVIRERMASRAHGKIERRLDKFILTDHSANGTYVTIEGDREIVLRREEFTLRSHGWIAFGQPRATSTDVIEFFCE
jgi:hypothetical protein